METNAKNNNGAVKGINPVKADKVAKFVAGNPVNKVSAKVENQPEQPQQEEQQQEQTNAEKQGVVAPTPQAQPQAEAVKPEPAKTEIKPEKPVLNLDETIKLLETLHVKKVQRDKLLGTINNLEAFKLDLEKEADETGGNYYQGCVLKISDDERREFVTKNPVIIQAVAQFVNALCVDKLAEIEAGIIIPNA